MNVLVTGVAGYVGCVCAEVLIERGHNVFGVDSLATGHRKAVPPQAKFQECDIADRAALDRIFRADRIDAVMHFAAESLVEKSVREPSAFYVVDVAKSILLLDAMIAHGVKRLIFSSTAAVYGEPERTPIPEDHRKQPVNPYGQCKLRYEQILGDYRAFTGLQFVALRYFNAAGASAQRGEDHANETHLIPRLLEVVQGKRQGFQVNGGDYPTPDGTCVRDYIHVLDIAEAHVLALANLERVAGEAFNVGNNRGYSVKEVLEVTRRVTGYPIPADIALRRAGDPAVLVASSEKIRRELGWQPRRSDLEVIVQSAWNWRKRFPAGYS